MTVTTSDRSVDYTGNGATIAFPYNFKIYKAEHVKVSLLTIATGAVQELTDSEYAITGIGYFEIGGVVTYPLSGTPLASTHKIIIERVVPYTQEQAINNQAGYRPETVERSLDLTVMMVQQVAETLVDKTIRVPDYENSVQVLPPVAARKGKFMYFDATTGQPVAADGTATLNVPPGGITASDIAVGAIAENLGYTPADAAELGVVFDGVDDNVFDNSAAWAAARTASGDGGTIYVRHKTPGGKYRFISTQCDLSNRVIIAEEGVEFIGNLNMSAAVQAPEGLRLTMNFDYGGGLVTYPYDVEIRQPASDARPLRPGPVKPEPRKDYFLPANLISMEKVAWTGGTSFAPDTVGASYSDGNVAWNNITTDGFLRAALVPSWGEFGGRTIRGSWGYVTSSNVYIAFAVECSQGWASIHVLGDGGAPEPYYAQEWHKPYSAGAGAGTKVKEFTWSGRLSLQSRLPRMARWEFVPIDLYTMALCLDGVEVRRMDLSALGEIQRHGPAVIGAIAGPTNIQFGYVHVSEGRRPRIGKTRRLVVVGDSRSDHTPPVMLPVQWPEFAAARIDESYGCRISQIVNLAVAGQRTSEQRTVAENWINGQADVEGDILVVNLGTNDEQALGYYPDSVPTVVYANQKAIFDLALSRGMFVVCVVFEAFYPRALAAAETGILSQGQNVVQYQVGADLRGAVAQAALLAEPASKRTRVGLVDGMGLLGDELPALLKRDQFTKPRLADNIHGNSKYAQLFGEAIAEEVLRVVLPPLHPSALVGVPVAAYAMAAGFTAGADLHFSLEGATCRLQGTIIKTAGSWNPSVVLTLPHYVRPAATVPLLFQDGGATVMVGNLYANGQVQFFTTSAQSSIRVCFQWTIRR
jgi:hypothetical protein